jgi:hypothetical protein
MKFSAGCLRVGLGARALRRFALVASVLALPGCSGSPELDVPVPATWSVIGVDPGSIHFEADGTGSVHEFPLSHSGPACDPQGSERVSGPFTWSGNGTDDLVISLEGETLPFEPRYSAWQPDWEVIYVGLCTDGREGGKWIRLTGGLDAPDSATVTATTPS